MGASTWCCRGSTKFTIHAEEEPAVGRLYRRAVITPIEESVPADERDELRSQRQRLETLLAPLLTGGLGRSLPAAMPDEDLVNALAQYLELAPLEKLALLEQRGALARCRTMVELLEMKALRDPGSGIRDQ